MKTKNTNYIGSFFVLIISILLITSCLEMNSDGDVVPAKLQGKWRLIRIEEAVKTVSPPTEDYPVWIEFTEITPDAVSEDGFPYKFQGESLVNLYFGGYKVIDSSLNISPVGSTKRGGPAAYIEFDSYFYNKLHEAKSYFMRENNQTLIIETKEDDLLIFTRYNNED